MNTYLGRLAAEGILLLGLLLLATRSAALQGPPRPPSQTGAVLVHPGAHAVGAIREIQHRAHRRRTRVTHSKRHHHRAPRVWPHPPAA
jgi:hypothetical protein